MFLFEIYLPPIEEARPTDIIVCVVVVVGYGIEIVLKLFAES